MYMFEAVTLLLITEFLRINRTTYMSIISYFIRLSLYGGGILVNHSKY